MLIRNGMLCLPNEDKPIMMDIKIRNGVISEIGNNLKDEEVIDASGLLVFPGCIDPHVHFDDPGYTDREDFYHGSSAAASGGVTTVIDMPCTSIPPVVNLRNLQEKLAVVEKKSVVDFAFYGGVSAQSFEQSLKQDMAELQDQVVGFKTYFLSGMDTFGSVNHYQFEKILEKAKELDKIVLLHAEDKSYVEFAETEEKKKGSSWQNYYSSRPEVAEILAVQNAVTIAKKVEAQLHIVHIGTSEAAELLKLSKNITGETCPHYLRFSLTDLEKVGSSLKTAPVVKTSENREQLWQQLADETLCYVASDHAPAPERQKSTGSIWTDYSGIPGSGTLFPYLLSGGYFANKITLSRLIKISSENAAKRFGLYDRKGSIEIGKDADLIMVDPNKEWIVRGAEFYSKGKITPFEGQKFRGKIMSTIIRGNIVYDSEKGIVQNPGYGNFLRP